MANTLPATGTVNALGFESEAPNNFAFATWRAIPFSPDGPAVFLDGSKVPAYNGQLDADGVFDGALIGDTSQMRPPSVSYMFTVNPVASVPPITISNVRYTSTTPQTLGEILSAQIGPLRIQAAALVYAYSQEQIINPTAGSGYVNTTTAAQWVFVGSGSVGQWIEVVGSDSGGGTPGGPNTAVQFNAGGLFGGDANLRYVSPNLFVGGDLQTATFAAMTGSHGTVPGKTTIRSDASNAAIDPPGTGSIYLCVDQGGGTIFSDGAGTGALVGQVDRLGNARFNGTVTAGSTLHAQAASNLDGAVTALSTLDVKGTTGLEGALVVGGTSELNGETTVGNPAGSALVISPTGGYQGAPTIATANGGPVDLSNFGDGIVMQDIGGDVLSVIAAGHLAIQMFAAGGQEWGEINNTNSAFNVAAGAAATNGIHLVYHGGGVSIALNGQPPLKTYNVPTIADQTASRTLATAFQNNSGMTLAVSMTGLTSGSAIGSMSGLVGPANPPANLVYKNENTASVSGAEVAVVLMVPPGWWYEVTGAGDITGIGRWWEWTCP